MRLLLFTDLDNCLLDHDTYEWKPAIPALDLLKHVGAEVILTTSKTAAEVLALHREMGLGGPVIVENGGVIVWADGRRRWLGRPVSEIRSLLDEAAAEAEADILPFGRMSVEDVVLRTNLPAGRAPLALRREASEPFVLGNPEREQALRAALEARGLRLTRGGRFHHALAHEGKHAAVALVIGEARAEGAVRSIGLGDGLNDEGFLRVVDIPVVLPGKHAATLMARLASAKLAPAPGPSGWRDAVLDILQPASD
jgi:mannosyl-3-phosphoglycerate phosphatase